MKNLLYNFKQKNTFVLIIMFFLAVSLNAQNSWLGSVNNDWQTKNNWSANIIPDKNTDVIIESSCTYYPDLNNSSDSCKSILIKTGGTLNIISGGNLCITGDLSINGMFNAVSGSLKVTGNLILNNGASMTIKDCNILCADAVLDINSTITYTGTNIQINNWNYGNLILDGIGTMQITGDSTIPTICNNLTVNDTGNYLEIPENKSLTVNGTLTNNAGLSGIIIESGPLGDGSLISSTSNINATVKRYITGNRWHYLSAPIDAAPVSLFNTNNFMWWDASLEWTGAGDYNPWKAYTNSNLENALGYAYYYSEDTIEYKGNMNVSNYNVTLHKSATGTSDYQGWNLVGNPYTSVLDWDALVFDGAVPVGAENAIYFFDDDDGSGSQNNYKYYVPSTGGTYGVGTANATGKIPMGQAFFIKTNSDNITLSFKSLYRAHNTQEFYKNKSSEIIKLKLTGNNTSDEMIFRKVKDAALGFDSQFDAAKLFSDDKTIPQIYSLSNEDDKKIAINSIPDIINNTKLVLGYKAVAGNYTLNLEEMTMPNNGMYLYDSFLKKNIDINKVKKYNFTHTGGEVNNRFSLIFNTELSEIEDIKPETCKFYPNPAKDRLTINFNKDIFPEGTVKIITITGHTCFSSNFNDSITDINIENLPNGIYFLKIKNNNNITEIHKFIIHK